MMNNNNNLGFIGIFRIIRAVLTRIVRLLSSTNVSVVVCIITESLKMSFDRAISLQKNSLNKNGAVAKETQSEYIYSLVKEYPIESAYIYNYILPSLQFTAIFQVGSNELLVGYNTVIMRGLLKATSSMIVIVIKQIENDETLDVYKAILPFFKEPAVSTCKVFVPDNLFVPEHFVPPHTKKFVCNLVGEASHNFGKMLFGFQKLDTSDLAKSMPIKAVWKTAHQGLESVLVSRLGNPFGFYVASLVPRSWGNAFLEELTDKKIPIHNLYTLARDYFFESIPYNISGASNLTFSEEN